MSAWMRSRWSLWLLGMTIVAAPTIARAQFPVRPWLSWRTIETEHFALHYPVQLETWTREVAEHVESIQTAVARVVGYTPPKRTHIVVEDPYASANGAAFPFLERPVISLWATPHDPRDDIGTDFRRWSDLLVAHEFAHVAHLSRPSRNPLQRFLWDLLPVHLGPIALKAPRWA